MQIQKDEIYVAIIEAAEKEFLEFGFNNMSLRRIAASIPISVSNIYNYFKNKDELFSEIVKPAVDYIEKIIIRSKDKQHLQSTTPEYIEWHIRFINLIYKFIKKHRIELILLFTKSSGSKFDNYKKTIVEKYTEMQTCTSVNGDNLVSDFFMYNFTFFYLNFLENLAIGNFNDDKIKQHLVEMTIYSHGGFIALLDKEESLYQKIMSLIDSIDYEEFE